MIIIWSEYSLYFINTYIFILFLKNQEILLINFQRSSLEFIRRTSSSDNFFQLVRVFVHLFQHIT